MEKMLLVEAGVAVVCARVAVRALPFRSTLRGAQRLATALGTARASEPGQEHPTIQQVALAVDRAANHLPGSTCLPRALAGLVLMAKNGCPAELRIGVRNEGAFEAHAWLERDGEIVLGGRMSSGFVPFSLDGAAGKDRCS